MAEQILIVDDEIHMAAFLTECLSGLGYDLAVAYDGAEALARIHARPPALVLVDIMLPGVGGWELVRSIRAQPRCRDIPIVVCTARRDRAPAGDIIQGLVYKPFRVEDIRRVISLALGH